jgi:hypothetical protein
VLADARHRLSPGRLVYPLTLDARLPTVGRHRLHAVVLVPEALAVTAAPGPILRVVAAGATADAASRPEGEEKDA